MKYEMTKEQASEVKQIIKITEKHNNPKKIDFYRTPMFDKDNKDVSFQCLYDWYGHVEVDDLYFSQLVALEKAGFKLIDEDKVEWKTEELKNLIQSKQDELVVSELEDFYNEQHLSREEWEESLEESHNKIQAIKNCSLSRK